MKRINSKNTSIDPGVFLDGAKCTTKPVGKISDKLTIVVQAAAKKAFILFLTLNHLIGVVNTVVVSLSNLSGLSVCDRL